MLDFMLNVLCLLGSLIGIALIVFVVLLISYFIVRGGQIIKEEIQEQKDKKNGRE